MTRLGHLTVIFRLIMLTERRFRGDCFTFQFRHAQILTVLKTLTIIQVIAPVIVRRAFQENGLSKFFGVTGLPRAQVVMNLLPRLKTLIS